MSDIALLQAEFGFDFSVSSGELAMDEGLKTAVIISLFSDARASDTDLAPGVTDKAGWWGDEFLADQDDKLGSKLWTLAREKRTATLLTRAEEFSKQALQWLVDDEVALSVDVSASFTDEGYLALDIKITRPVGDPTAFKFYSQWQGQFAGE